MTSTTTRPSRWDEPWPTSNASLETGLKEDAVHIATFDPPDRAAAGPDGEARAGGQTPADERRRSLLETRESVFGLLKVLKK